MELTGWILDGGERFATVLFLLDRYSHIRASVVPNHSHLNFKFDLVDAKNLCLRKVFWGNTQKTLIASARPILKLEAIST